ncbi:helix-turn-helix transcriptional regulator [Shewanella avicenniae]|uniref:Helix-turn-helix transcriptional regulator n=1 Tax=Shewanella avicenniae TaxID=2814294 RepID=A0ABX7QQK8_9GAMM|nr:helix-turn-helix transcriptional regulator [Shewanella avicenniae]QSX33751.1 helix-turn-helix transcriptional regulator [Shewanella avicenniae]
MAVNPLPIRLKQARKRAGITQKKLGVMIGMDESSASGRMNHYEKGRHTPDFSTLKKMAEILEVPLSYFFQEDELSAEISIEVDKLSKAKKLRLLKFISELKNNPAE